MDEALGKLLELTGGGTDHSVMDTLSSLLRTTAWNYTEVTDGLKWKDSTQLLPLQSVCNSLTVSQQSELALQFRHHVGLSLTDSKTVEDFLLSAYAVRQIGQCSLYDSEKVWLSASNFITRLDFLRNAKFHPEFLANIVFEIRGRYLHVLQWFPKLIARMKLLFHPSSTSNYYRYLANGAIQFRHRNCTLRMITTELLREQIRKNPHKYSAQVLHDFHTGVGPRPPYLLVQKTPIQYWKRKFGSKALEIRQVMLASYLEHSALTTPEAIKIAIILKNQQLSRTSPGEFELTLQSVTASGKLKKYFYNGNSTVTAPALPDRTLTASGDKPHIRRKRHPIIVFLQGALRLISQIGQRLIRFFRGWSGTVIGSNLGRAVQRVYSNLQGAAKGWSSQLRTQHSIRQLLGKMGPAQRALTPFVRTRSLGNFPLPVRQLKFGPGRYSSLQLPKPLTKQLSLFSPEKLQLRQRLVNLYAWTKQNAMLAISTAATTALFGFSIAITSDDSNQYICNYTATPYADGAHVWQAAQNWQSIVNQTYFIYQPITMDREQARLLQIDIYGSAMSNGTTGNKTLADLYDSALHEAYDSDVVSIYDLSLPVELRRRALLKIRQKNQLLRELDSMSFTAAKYAQKSPLHERALNNAELFIGILMTGHTTLLPDDKFMDTMIRNLIASNDLETFCKEVEQYRDLVFIQLQDAWSPETRAKFMHAAEGLQDHFTVSDLEQFDKTLDPQAREVFTMVLRKDGREHLYRYNHQMNLLLSAESERRFWKNTYGSHRLLYDQAPVEMPNNRADYLVTLFWFQMYLAEEGRMQEIDDFILAMGRLSLIRLYDENRAVGLPIANLESKIAPQDLKVLKESGLKGIADSKPPDDTTFTDYDSLSTLANANTSLIEFSPSLSDYEGDDEGILKNDLVGLNNIYDSEDEKNKKRRKRDLYQTRQKRILAKRAADRILSNFTSNEDLMNELHLFAQHPTRSLLLMERFKRSQGQLDLLDMLQLEEHLQDTKNKVGATTNDLKKMYHDYIVSAISYIKTHPLPGEISALLLTPQQSIDLPDIARAQLQTASRLLKIRPLTSLMEKQALLNYLRNSESEKDNISFKIQGLENVVPFLLLLFLSFLGNAALLYAVCVRRNILSKERGNSENGEIEETHALQK